MPKNVGKPFTEHNQEGETHPVFLSEKNIVLIALDFYGPGAVSIGARQQVQALLSAQIPVCVITDRLPGKECSKFLFKNSTKLTEKKVWCFRIPRMGMAGREIPFALGCLYVLARLIVTGKVSMVINQVSTACFPVECLCRMRRIPTVFIIRSLMSERLRAAANPYNNCTTLLYRITNRFAVRHSSRCIAVSSYIKREAKVLGATEERIEVLYNPVDTTLFAPKPEVEKKIDILFVGRCSIEKGLPDLMTAIGKLPSTVKTTIVGEGMLKEEMVAVALNRGYKVEFLGAVENNKLPDIIVQARVQVVPSVSEPLGRVVLEAMACGVPVIGARTGGIAELIEDGVTGWFVPVRDPSAIARVLNRVLWDEKLLNKTGVAARERALKFDLAHHDKRFVMLCRQFAGAEIDVNDENAKKCHSA